MSASSTATGRDRSMPRGMYSVLSGMQRSSSSARPRSPSMMNDEAIQLAHYPDARRPSPGQVPKIERDDFPAPPFPYTERNRHLQQVPPTEAGLEDENNKENNDLQYQQQQEQQQQRQSRPRSREIPINYKTNNGDYDQDIEDDEDGAAADPQVKKEEEELSKIASGIGKIFLQTLKEREKIRAWKRANLDPRNASRTPSATRELHQGLRYDNPTNASPSRDLDRIKPAWSNEPSDYVMLDNSTSDHSPTRTRSSLGRTQTTNPTNSQHMLSTNSTNTSSNAANNSSASYGYKVVQSNRFTPKPGYGLRGAPPYSSANTLQQPQSTSHLSSSYNNNNNTLLPNHQQLTGPGTIRSQTGGSSSYLNQLLAVPPPPRSTTDSMLSKSAVNTNLSAPRSLNSSAIHSRRSMPNVNQLLMQQQQQQLAASHLEPPKLYPYHLLVTSNYRLPPDVDRCHLERHLSNEEFQYIFACDRLDFYRLPEWRRNELKRRAKLF